MPPWCLAACNTIQTQTKEQLKEPAAEPQSCAAQRTSIGGGQEMPQASTIHDKGFPKQPVYVEDYSEWAGLNEINGTTKPHNSQLKGLCNCR